MRSSMMAFGDFSAATEAEMSFQFHLGDETFASLSTWARTPNGWRAPKDH